MGNHFFVLVSLLIRFSLSNGKQFFFFSIFGANGKIKKWNSDSFHCFNVQHCLNDWMDGWHTGLCYQRWTLSLFLSLSVWWWHQRSLAPPPLKPLASSPLIKCGRRLSQEMSRVQHRLIRAAGSLMERQRAGVERGIVGGRSSHEQWRDERHEEMKQLHVKYKQSQWETSSTLLFLTHWQLPAAWGLHIVALAMRSENVST